MLFKDLSAKIIVFEYNEFLFIAALVFFAMIYLVSKKIIFWATEKGLESFLSYVLAGLLFLNLFLIIFIIYEVTAIKGLLVYFLQITGLFGALLILGLVTRFLIRKLFRKKA